MRNIKNYIEKRIKNCQRHIDNFVQKYNLNDEKVVNTLNYHGGYHHGYWDGRCEAFKEILDELHNVIIIKPNEIKFNKIDDYYFHSVETAIPYTIHYDTDIEKYIGYVGTRDTNVRLVICSDDNFYIVRDELYKHYIKQLEEVEQTRIINIGSLNNE